MGDADVQKSLKQVSDVAALYGVTEEDVRQWREGIAERPPWAQRAHVSAVIAQRLVVTAADHRKECDREDCRTCAGLKELLTVALAGVRTVVDDSLRENYRRPSAWPWGRKGGGLTAE